jgi:hypothetical protein
LYVRFYYLLATPEYFQNSGCFRVSNPRTKVKAGDALYFLADKVCHRAPPPHHVPKKGMNKCQSSSSPLQEDGLSQFLHGEDGKRRVLFWFSWDDAVSANQQSLNQPDLDFQLNPWTLHHLLFQGGKYADDQVLFFLSFFFFLIDLSDVLFSFIGCSLLFHEVDGFLSIPALPREVWEEVTPWTWRNFEGKVSNLSFCCLHFYFG